MSCAPLVSLALFVLATIGPGITGIALTLGMRTVQVKTVCPRIEHRRLTVLFTLTLFGFLFATAAFYPANAEPLTLEARFQSELDGLYEQYRFPGATAAFMLPDGTVTVVATGLADVELGIPMTRQTRMLAASIGKTFVGAVVVALSRQGVLNLEDPVSKWLGDRPWFSRLPNQNRITLRHLLNHSSGIGNHIEEESFAHAFREKWRSPSNPFGPEDLIAFVLDRPPLFEPGEGWHYSDTGYLLLGLVIEKAAGRSYYEEVARRFLLPLGLTLTSPSDHPDLPGLAAGYLALNNPFSLPVKTTTRPGIMAWHPGLEWTGGGLVSNPGDLVIWANALFEGRAMEKPYLEDLLMSVPVSSDDPDTRYGTGVGIHKSGPMGPTYGHGGWIPGYCSSLRYYSQYGFAVAFQINTDVGVVDHSTSVIDEMEIRLAKVLLTALLK